MNTPITWVNPSMFLWLIAAALLAIVVTGSLWSRHAALRRAFSSRLLPIMLPGANRRSWPAAMCGVLAFVLLIFAAADPRWGRTTREVPQRGIEVVFLLDVSRSMLAEDVPPNRLERAKQQIKDMIDEMAGDRVGLVVFAGEARQVVPMTSHYEDFKQQLDELGPLTLRRGGSKLGDAITVAADAFLEKSADHKAIVIFTDGEDQESDPVGRATTAYRNQGVRIFPIGLGDELQGSTIPETDPDDPRQRSGDVVRYAGKAVVSKMNGEVLQALAEKSKGQYFAAGTKRVNMSEVYHGFVANVPQREFETATVDALTLRFEWFAVSALILLLLEILWSRPRLALLLLCVWTGGSSVVADESQYRSGLTAAESEKFEEAIGLFSQSATSTIDDLAADSRANQANLRMRIAGQLADKDIEGAIAQLKAAITNYRDALRISPDKDHWRANVELAARWMEQLQDQQRQEDQQQQQEQKEQQEQQEESPNQKDPADQQPQDPSDDADPDQSPSNPKQDPEEPTNDPAEQPKQGSQPEQGEQPKQGNEPEQGEQSEQPEPSEGAEPRDDAEVNEEPETQEGPTQDQLASGDGPQAKELSREEAEKLLQSVRDRDMLRRFIQQQRELKRQVPVDKDW